MTLITKRYTQPASKKAGFLMSKKTTYVLQREYDHLF